MSCAECSPLSSHVFRSPDDLVHALRTAAEEMNRGVLRRLEERELRPAEEEALVSVLESGALPGKLRYRFRCEVCGDHFLLAADPRLGEGSWTREEEP